MPLDPMRLRAAIAANFPAQLAWLSRLVAFDSTRGREAPCQDWIAAELAARGYAVDRFSIAEVDLDGLPGKSEVVDVDYTRAIQVVATHEVDTPAGKSLILQGHIDVVPPGAPELWDQPPFEARLADGWITGRGTGDMKGGVSAMVFALDALASLGLEPASRVHIKTVSEEECTGNGALATLARGYRADAALIPESMGHRILRAELGSVWFRLRILGRPDHVLAARGPGAHAILAAQDYMAALQGLADAMNIEAQKHRWFSQIHEPVKFNPGKIRGATGSALSPPGARWIAGSRCCLVTPCRMSGRGSRRRLRPVPRVWAHRRPRSAGLAFRQTGMCSSPARRLRAFWRRCMRRFWARRWNPISCPQPVTPGSMIFTMAYPPCVTAALPAGCMPRMRV